MRKLFYGIIMLMMMSSAYANDIYVTQSGATLELNIKQDGQDNKVGNSTTASTVHEPAITQPVVPPLPTFVVETKKDPSNLIFPAFYRGKAYSQYRS